MRVRHRTIEHVEFSPSDPTAVLAFMDRLSSAREGWINFLPGVPEEEVDTPPQGVFSALFGSAQPPVSMCTWMPRSPARRGGEETVGVMHPRGRFAIKQLAATGAPLPPGWRVAQDHGRRGLVVHPPQGASHQVVLDWLLRAGASLAAVPLTGSWQARIHLPRPSRSPLSG